MNTSQNTHKSDKQITFRVSEEEHQKIRIEAAIEGSLTPNQYAKKYLLEKVNSKSIEQNLNPQES
ncbi:hypothetical protein E0H80_10620 [Acinetobacter sp. ANC 4779]|uniref:hypothetical protein n=1 Tax=Acinetobacter sp. ANC 4779 TaxID=2529848 RepID=UPI00103B17EE|nr:hypothetical protein [Acinetobacter sp. ANC 4779]TCB49858.1 hypothetical protein E0H80_10620 [Acinetobacter sp. ANC 4779]